MAKWTPPKPAEPFVPWKPDECEVPGCASRHPSYSRDGIEGPWRCREHDRTAGRKPPPDPFGEPSRTRAEPPPPQDRLL